MRILRYEPGGNPELIEGETWTVYEDDLVVGSYPTLSAALEHDSDLKVEVESYDAYLASIRLRLRGRLV